MGCSTEDFSPGDDEQEENNPRWLPEMVEVEKIDAKTQQCWLFLG